MKIQAQQKDLMYHKIARRYLKEYIYSQRITYCIMPRVDWGGYPTPNDPGTIPATWEDGISTLAIFDGLSSSAKKLSVIIM